MSTALQMQLDWIPCSKKNNVEIRQNHVSKQRWVGPNKRVKQEERRIRTSAKAAIANGCKMLKDYDLAVTKAVIQETHDIGMAVTLTIGKSADGDRCSITVSDLGIPPKRKRTGRIRDAINVPAIIADALQGVCYEDDKQITRLVVEVEHE